MYQEGSCDAAVAAEMKESTPIHRTLGRQSAEDYHKSRRLLKEEEEEILTWRCDILHRAGFPQCVKNVTELAEEILQHRDPPRLLVLDG